MATDPVLVLYQRDDCHLCDLALAVMAEARAPAFESVFIDDDTSLEAEYGHRVPVLRDTQRGVELDWPFDAGAVAVIDVRERRLSSVIGDVVRRPWSVQIAGSLNYCR